MNQIESIQNNIHHTKIKLNKIRRSVADTSIDSLNKQNGIEFYINELKELKSSLKRAVQVN